METLRIYWSVIKEAAGLFQAVKDAWTILIPGIFGIWAYVENMPSVLIALCALGAWALILLVAAVTRHHRAFDCEYLFEKVDSELPSVRWDVRVWRQWEMPGKDEDVKLGRRVLGKCVNCNLAQYVDENFSGICRKCDAKIGTHDEWNKVKHHIINEAKGCWENGREGYQKVPKSDRVDQ